MQGRSPGLRSIVQRRLPKEFLSGKMTRTNRLQSRGRLRHWVPNWVTLTAFPFHPRMLCILLGNLAKPLCSLNHGRVKPNNDRGDRFCGSRTAHKIAEFRKMLWITW